MTVAELLALVADKPPQWRVGQALWNMLPRLPTQDVRLIEATPRDPYYQHLSLQGAEEWCDRNLRVDESGQIVGVQPKALIVLPDGPEA